MKGWDEKMGRDFGIAHDFRNWKFEVFEMWFGENIRCKTFEWCRTRRYKFGYTHVLEWFLLSKIVLCDLTQNIFRNAE